MIVWATGLVAVVLWAGVTYFALRYMRRSRAAGREDGLRFELQAAPWSDSHVESLLRREPRSPTLLYQYAANAIERQDWEEAERRVALFQSRTPRAAEAWICEADLLRRRGRPAEARVVVEKAARRLARQPAILLASAREALWAREWPEAARRFSRLRAVAPDRSESYAEGAEALAASGDAAAAEALLAEGQRRLPKEWPLWQAMARLAERRGDLAAAVQRWALLRERFPGEVHGYLGGAAALERAGDAEGARLLLAEARDFFPGNREVREALERLAPPPAASA